MWHKVLEEIINALLQLGMAIGAILLFPITYIIWGIYNREKINIWLSVLLAITSTLILYQCYDSMSIPPDKKTTWLQLQLWVFGATNLTIPFLMTRLISCNKLKFITFNKNLTPKCNMGTTRLGKYFFGFVTFFWQIMLFRVFILIYLYNKHPIGIQFFLLISSILIWFSLAVYLFIKYPDDKLIDDFYSIPSRYGLKIAGQDK